MLNSDIEENGEFSEYISGARDPLAEPQVHNKIENDRILICNSELVDRFKNIQNPLDNVSKYNSYFRKALFQGCSGTLRDNSSPENIEKDSDAGTKTQSIMLQCPDPSIGCLTTRIDSVQYCLNSANNRTANLNDALDNMSLAYNPITKQLLFVSPKNQRKAEPSGTLPICNDSLRKGDDFSDEGNYSLSNGDKTESLSSGSPGSTLPRGRHQRDKDGGSFSSTISNWSEYSIPGSSTSRDDELNGDSVPQEISVSELVQESEDKPKKKIFTQFFTRKVFHRKNGEDESESKCKLSAAEKLSSWKIFGNKVSMNETRLTPPCAGNISIADTHLTHRRQGSSTSEKNFEDIIASSTALIQHDRPAGLPAKDAAEADRHAAEVARLVAAARKRAAEFAAQSAVHAAARRKKEAQRDAALSTWRTALLDWESMRQTRQIQDLWWNGIPPPVRGRVWQFAISNNLNITSKLYELCAKEAKHRLEEAHLRRISMKLNNHEDAVASNCSANCAKDSIDSCLEQQDNLNKCFKSLSDHDKQSMHRNNSEKNFKTCSAVKALNLSNSKSDPDLSEFGSESGMELIELDIARTFPNLCIFQPGGPYFDVLHEVLAAYACYRPDIGYVQGMSFIAAILILNMDAPDAFTCFANLLNGPILRAAFTRDETAVQRIWCIYTALLVDQLPSLENIATELVPELYLLEWLYTAFAKAMPLDAACRVWDMFIRDGDEFLLRTALGILRMYQDKIVNMDFISASQFLTKLPEDICIDTLFKNISFVNMSIGKKSFQDLIAAYCQSESEMAHETDTVVRL